MNKNQRYRLKQKEAAADTRSQLEAALKTVADQTRQVADLRNQVDRLTRLLDVRTRELDETRTLLNQFRDLASARSESAPASLRRARTSELDAHTVADAPSSKRRKQPLKTSSSDVKK